MSRACPYPAYSRAERLVDAGVHVAGLLAALTAVPVLITLVAVWHGDATRVTAASVYGASLIAMIAASAAYHLIRRPGWYDWLRRLDHAAIYAKIAGTYTPFALLHGAERAVPLLLGIWGAAAAGSLLKVIAPRRFEAVSIALYLAMGWAIAVVGGPILERASPATVALITIGGVLYTLGVGFHLWSRLPFQNAIWHALVLAASVAFYVAVLREVALAA